MNANVNDDELFKFGDKEKKDIDLFFCTIENRKNSIPMVWFLLGCATRRDVQRQKH